MIDVRLLRTDLDRVRAALARKGVPAGDVERAAALDTRARELVSRRDELRARSNTIAKDSQQARRAGDEATAQGRLAVDRNGDAFEEIRPPTLARTDPLIATGQLPKFADDAYHLERDDLWAIPTAEVPLTSIGRDEVLAEADLPMRLMAYT